MRRGKGVSAWGVLLRGALVTTLAVGTAAAVGRMNLVPEQLDALAKRTVADRPASFEKCHFHLDTEVTALRSSECDSRPGVTPRVAIWGDSHALAWQPFAWALADARGQSAASFTMDSCPPMKDYSFQRRDFPRHSENCKKFNALALERLSDPGAFDLVVLARRWPMDVNQALDTAATLKLTDESQTTLHAMEMALEKLKGVPQVVLVEPLPLLHSAASLCIAAGREHRCSLSRGQFDRAAEPWRRELVGLARRHPNVTLLDPTDFFCNAERCLVTRDGYALYWDDDHVAATAAAAFAREFLREPGRYTVVTRPPPAAAPR